jgi:hypothetical protein
MNTSNDGPRRLEQALAQKFIAASGAQPADKVTIAGTGAP